MSETVDRWLQQAQYDLETAKAMMEAGRHLYVLFCCQQAVEKALKAVIAKRTNEPPPRLHQLVRLAEAAGLSLDDRRADFLRELSAYYMEMRYPDTLGVAAEVDGQLARGVLRRTVEAVRWLNSILSS